MSTATIPSDHPILLDLARNFADPHRRVVGATGQHIYRLSEPAVEAFLAFMKPTLDVVLASEEEQRAAKQKQAAADEHEKWHGPNRGNAY
jgi:hypothetical protein